MAELCHAQGAGLTAWLKDSGARPGDTVALRRKGAKLLIKLFPHARWAAGRPSPQLPALVSQGSPLRAGGARRCSP